MAKNGYSLSINPEEVVESINKLYSFPPRYDHRKFLTYDEKHDHIKLRDATEDYMVRYAWFKYCVAEALKPFAMLEIGVRGGCSALAFLHARPTMWYLGIDSNRDGVLDGRNYLGVAEKWFEELGFKATVLIGDSQKILMLPSVDFAHIDGCHSRECTCHDVLIAAHSGIPWILVDDSSTTSVREGINDAVASIDHKVKVFEFPNIEGGNTLLYLEAQ